MRILGIVLGLTLCAASDVARGQTDAKPAPPATPSGPPHSRIEYGPNFGTTTLVWQRLTAPEFDPDTSGTTYTSTWVPEGSQFNYRRYVTSGYAHLLASPHLPGGARVTAIKFSYCDTNASSNHLKVNLYDCDDQGTCNPAPIFAFDSGSFALCPTSYTFSGFFDYTVDNANRQLLVDVIFPSTDGSLQLSGVAFGYTLQVSPARRYP